MKKTEPNQERIKISYTLTFEDVKIFFINYFKNASNLGWIIICSLAFLLGLGFTNYLIIIQAYEEDYIRFFISFSNTNNSSDIFI